MCGKFPVMNLKLSVMSCGVLVLHFVLQRGDLAYLQEVFRKKFENIRLSVGEGDAQFLRWEVLL